MNGSFKHKFIRIISGISFIVKGMCITVMCIMIEAELQNIQYFSLFSPSVLYLYIMHTFFCTQSLHTEQMHTELSI